MKKAFAILTALLALVAIVAVAGDQGAWFDMEKCDFCKHLTTDPNFLPNTEWNHYTISNGFVNITTYKPEFKETWVQVTKDMEDTGKRMMAGEKLNMCGMCTDMGALMQAGAKYESIEIDNGSLTIWTSDDEALVKKLQAHAQMNTEEMAKMMEMQEGMEKTGHEGHNH